MGKQIPKKPPVEPKSSGLHPYSAVDPIPVPEAIESDSDTAWGMWEDSIMPADAVDTDFHPTVPSDLQPESGDKPTRRKG